MLNFRQLGTHIHAAIDAVDYGMGIVPSILSRSISLCTVDLLYNVMCSAIGESLAHILHRRSYFRLHLFILLLWLARVIAP